mmetsp:Transcript_5591/g.8569  ORF Transcript_5591/g.8569 Transcript_5591/m.8569 type:complete len:145 (-) Transcript_5591:23-457(-)
MLWQLVNQLRNYIEAATATNTPQPHLLYHCAMFINQTLDMFGIQSIPNEFGPRLAQIIYDDEDNNDTQATSNSTQAIGALISFRNQLRQIISDKESTPKQVKSKLFQLSDTLRDDVFPNQLGLELKDKPNFQSQWVKRMKDERK